MKSARMLNLELFKQRLHSFPSKYMEIFDYVWKWKLQIEQGKRSVLSNGLDTTHPRLAKILNKWQTYRNARALFYFEQEIL
jgi:hypothetical protein